MGSGGIDPLILNLAPHGGEWPTSWRGALPTGKESSIPIQAQWAPELVCMFLRRKKSVASGGI